MLLTVLFVLGRPWDLAEHERFRTQLRTLRLRSGELEQDLLRRRLGLPTGAPALQAQLAALREHARTLTPLPSFLGPAEREELQRGLDAYLAVLEATGQRVQEGGAALAEAELASLLERPLEERAAALVQTYLRQNELAVTRAERFRVGLFGASLLLALFVAYVLARLLRTGRALEGLNATLEAHVRERTDALATTNRELRESEADKAALLSASPDGVMALDAEGRLVDFSPAAERAFGLSRQQSLGRALTELVLPPGDAEGTWEALRGEVDRSPTGIRRRVAAQRASGERFPAELTLARVPEGSGLARYCAFLRDLTERVAVERMKNEFVSTVSHELRTPLTSIRGSLGLVEGGVMGEVPAPVLELVRIARANTDRLVRLVNDILDLEKMEAGKLQLRPEWLAPQELLHATEEVLRGFSDATGVTLRVDAPDVPAVRGDRDRLLQVLTNLTSNALKFSPPGAEVRLSVRAVAGGVRLSVEDHGPGIPAHAREQLFQKFSQLDGSDTRASGGTGLGLAISKAIVEQHGSRLEVESEVGRGSTFHFTLAPDLHHGAALPAEACPLKPAR